MIRCSNNLDCAIESSEMFVMSALSDLEHLLLRPSSGDDVSRDSPSLLVFSEDIGSTQDLSGAGHEPSAVAVYSEAQAVFHGEKKDSEGNAKSLGFPDDFLNGELLPSTTEVSDTLDPNQGILAAGDGCDFSNFMDEKCWDTENDHPIHSSSVLSFEPAPGESNHAVVHFNPNEGAGGRSLAKRQPRQKMKGGRREQRRRRKRALESFLSKEVDVEPPKFNSLRSVLKLAMEEFRSNLAGPMDA
eukprot:CAMPEP_0185849438 /NCGR_PEP_ID=MMETSP1354-20130828/3944_1 /TAXON_ID=708628 /ORGANISM="Erythrolobus madagascarensis, Strain CCMP3276" /LENGTH=243 /DNA_ID=CAMNT_0028549959 /DNA_START=97 /DNA_END=828 /DNA_ORIENTATION=-